jgi:hypothetical protein
MSTQIPNPPPTKWQSIKKGVLEWYYMPMKREYQRFERDEEDLFMMLVFAEQLGIPNPVSCYTLELMPIMYERFHAWHKRMGIPRSPLDQIGCC